MKIFVGLAGVADIVAEKSIRPSVATTCVPDPVQEPVELVEQPSEAALENVGTVPVEAVQTGWRTPLPPAGGAARYASPVVLISEKDSRQHLSPGSLDLGHSLASLLRAVR